LVLPRFKRSSKDDEKKEKKKKGLKNRKKRWEGGGGKRSPAESFKRGMKGTKSIKGRHNPESSWEAGHEGKKNLWGRRGGKVLGGLACVEESIRGGGWDEKRGFPIGAEGMEIFPSEGKRFQAQKSCGSGGGAADLTKEVRKDRGKRVTETTTNSRKTRKKTGKKNSEKKTVLTMWGKKGGGRKI